jgi:hypothetical protein
LNVNANYESTSMVDDLASDVKCDVGVDVPSASVAAAFRTVIEQHQAGDSRHYGRLLDSIDAMSKSSAACNSVPKLIVQCEQVSRGFIRVCTRAGDRRHYRWIV